jgi:hypothetical protein
MNTSQYCYRALFFMNSMCVHSKIVTRMDGEIKRRHRELRFCKILAWMLSGCCQSRLPRCEMRYDVSDYYGNLTAIWNMDNFRELVNLAHERCT